MTSTTAKSFTCTFTSLSDNSEMMRPMRASDWRGNVGTKPLYQRSTFSLQFLLFSCLNRLFSPDYVPSVHDIVRTRARTIGITETAFQLRDGEMLMIDVSGQKASGGNGSTSSKTSQVYSFWRT